MTASLKRMASMVAVTAMLAVGPAWGARVENHCCDDCVPARGDVAGAEDFELDLSTGSPRLIVSADARSEEASAEPSGGLYAFPITATGLAPKVTLAREFRDPRSGRVCPLRPHGISLASESSPPRLYVINHSRTADDGAGDCVLHRTQDGRVLPNQVVVYRVERDGLQVEDVLTDPRLRNPNDLAAHGSDLFVTNTPGTPLSTLLEYIHLGPSNVVHYDGTDWTEVLDHIRYPNGILATSDRVYVASIFDDRISVFRRQGGTLTPEREIRVPAHLDNLLWAVDDDGVPQDEAMYVAGHTSLGSFLAHMRDHDAASPADVFLVRPHDEQTVRRVHHNDGEAVRAASVGLVFRDYLYMGQVFESGVAVCECARCRP